MYKLDLNSVAGSIRTLLGEVIRELRSMERLHLFPQPFPDESFYSLAVRYHKLSANDSYRRTSQELFGVYSRTCGSILPCCLSALSQRLAPAYAVEELISRFTLLPLYEPFLSKAKYSTACGAMVGHSGTGLKMSLGMTASGFLKHGSFRYCKSCVEEDIHHCGSAYWHRNHQAIGTCTCPLHREVLCGMTFPDGADWRCMLLPGEAVGSSVMRHSDNPAAHTVSEMQLWGLEHHMDVRDLLSGNFIRRRLDEMGFIKAGRIREQALRRFLKLRLLGSPGTNEFQELSVSCDWTFGVLRPRGTVSQPFKFYFLCWLLEIDLEQLKSFRPRADICIGEVFKGSKIGSVVDASEIEAHRAAFSRSPNLKCHDKPGYQWLYRHDRQWLAYYVSVHPSIRLRKGFVDWETRDFELAQNLFMARDQILSAPGKPQRVTCAALDRAVTHSYGFLRMLSKFPISTVSMKKMLETNHDYQVRKIKWAVRHYLLPEQTAISVVFRFAGIRVPHVSKEEVLNILYTD